MFRELAKVLYWALTFRLAERLRQRSDIETIAASGLFDVDRYLELNSDVVNSEVDPVAHYVLSGAAEGRDPSPYFDTTYYLEQNPDVRKSRRNPLAHFIRSGSAELRNPHPRFDTRYYMATNPYLAESGVDVLLHYVEVGVHRRRRPHPDFASVLSAGSSGDGESANEKGRLPAAGGTEADSDGGAAAGPPIEGCVERFTQSLVSGWARDQRDPATSVLVDLRVDGELWRTVPAGRHREDLAQRLADGGNHGFIWEYPPIMFEERGGQVSIQPREGANHILASEGVVASFVNAKRLDPVDQGHRAPALDWEVPPRLCDASVQRVEIIVLNRDGDHLLEKFFSAFDAWNTYPAYSITIVDHGSIDDSEEVCEKWAERLEVRWLQRQSNYTFSESNNFAAQASDADILIFANNDIELSSDALGPLVAMLADERLSLVGIKLLDAPLAGSRDIADDHRKWIQHLGVHFDRFRRDSFKTQGQFVAPFETRAAPLSEPFCNIAVDSPAVTGAFVATRRSDFLEAGGFCEGYFYGYEDVDLCLTAVIARGKRVVCANQLTAFHDHGHSRARMSRKTALRAAGNGHLLDRRFGYAYRRRSRSDLFARPGFWNVTVPRIAFAVTEAHRDATAGDYFTSLELARELEDQFACQCYFLEPAHSWYDLSGIDVLITMVDHYDLSQIENASANLIRISWVRNWFDRFVENPSASSYDLVWASSSKAARFLEKKLAKRVSVLPLATNLEAFRRGSAREELASDYCFTGNYWQHARDIASHLDHRAIPFEGKIFGRGWEQVPALRDIAQGPLPYDQLPSVYASTKLVIDDANHVTKPWGSVNSRVFDALGAGRLVVTNGLIGNEEVFDGKLPTYASAEELSTVLDRYLGDDAARACLVAELREVVEARHTYRHRAAEAWRYVSQAAHDQLRFAIKIGTPTAAQREEWGDYHFALAMKRALDRQGHSTRIDCIDRWDCPETFGDDVVIVLRGLSRYVPRPSHINLVWLISHPDRVTRDELEGFDHVFVASQPYAETLRADLEVPTSVLLQCTDPEVFSPPGNGEPERDPDVSENEGVVLVGNSRKQFRGIIRDCLDAEVDFKVVGTHWEQILDEDRILARHIPNDKLGGFYARCELVLNDHWETMREHGFLSNRLFDAAACGAQILTDRVKGLEEVFGDVLLTYEGPDELARVAQSAGASLHSERSRRIELAERIRREHSFEVRIRDILAIVNALDGQKALGPDVQGSDGSFDAAIT